MKADGGAVDAASSAWHGDAASDAASAAPTARRDNGDKEKIMVWTRTFGCKPLQPIAVPWQPL